MSLDINTIFIVIIMTGIAIALILTVVGVGIDNSLLYWAGGFGINSVAFSLFSLRGIIHDMLSVVLANIMIVATFALFAHGLLSFLNRRANLLLIWLPCIVIAGAFPFMLNQVEGRMLVFGFMTAAQCVFLLLLMTANNSQLIGRGKYILMTSFVLGIGVSLARPVSILLGLEDFNAFNSPGISQSITFLPIPAFYLGVALALVLMQKEHAEAATDSIARSDDLTGLANRRRLYERISKLLSQRKSDREFGALMLIDLDNFKVLNDQYGHAVGDELLQQVAQRISNCIDNKDTAARLGGDEFVVLLTELGHHKDLAVGAAMQTADKIRAALAQPYALSAVSSLNERCSEIEHECTGSIGVTLMNPDMTDREAVLREADRAMYSAKNRSKGTVHLGEA